jgi:hypothetical protein
MLLEGYTHPECSTYLRVQSAEVIATSQLEPLTYKSCDIQRLLRLVRKANGSFPSDASSDVFALYCLSRALLARNGKNDWQLETGQVPAKGQERSQQRWRSKPRYNKHFDDCSWVQLTMWRLSTPTGEVCSIPNVFEYIDGSA